MKLKTFSLSMILGVCLGAKGFAEPPGQDVWLTDFVQPELQEEHEIVQQIGTELARGRLSLDRAKAQLATQLDLPVIQADQFDSTTADGVRIATNYFFEFKHPEGRLELSIAKEFKSLVHDPDFEPNQFRISLHFRNPLQGLTSIRFGPDGIRKSATVETYKAEPGDRFQHLFFDDGNKPIDIHFFQDPDLLPLDEIYNQNQLKKFARPRNRIRVAVIGTGVDYNHPHIAKFIPRYIEDGDLKILSKDFVDNDELAFDIAKDPVAHHETAVASIVLENQDPWIEIIPIRIDQPEHLLEAIKFALDNGARVIQMSFGVDILLHEVPARWIVDLNRLVSGHPRTLFVTAAGNEAQSLDEFQVYPPNIPATNLLVIGATDGREIWYEHGLVGSNYSPLKVDLFSPGVDRTAATPGGIYRSDHTGTSFAAPDISRMAAYGFFKRPQWTAAQLINEISKHIVDQEALAGLAIWSGIVDEESFRDALSKR